MLGCLAAAPVQVQLTRPQFQGADPLKPCCNWALAVAPAATENPGRPLSRSPVSSTGDFKFNELWTFPGPRTTRTDCNLCSPAATFPGIRSRHSRLRRSRSCRASRLRFRRLPTSTSLCDRPSRVIEVRQRPRKVTSTAQTGPNCDDIESTSLFRRPLSDPRRTTARLGVRASGQAAPPVAPGRDALRLSLSLSLSHHIAIAVPSRDTTQVAPPGARGQHGEFPGRRLEALC